MARKPTGRPMGRPRHPGPLTPAEERVLAELRLGLTNAEIGVRLGLSPDTVKTHVASMLSKLGLGDRRALAEWRPAQDTKRPWWVFGAGGFRRAGPRLALVTTGIAGFVLLLLATLVIRRTAEDRLTVSVTPSPFATGASPTPPPASSTPGTVVATISRRPPRPVLGAFDFIDAEDGWMVSADGTVWRSRDGGATWASIGDVTRNAETVSFRDASLGWVVAGGHLYQAIDGGMTWAGVTTPAKPWWAELTHDSGWIDTSEGVFKTLDGGATWAPVPNPCEAAGDVGRFVAAVSAAEVWALCTRGVKPLDLAWLMKSDTGGATWDAVGSEGDWMDFDLPDAPSISAPYLPRDIAVNSDGVLIIGGCGHVNVTRGNIGTGEDFLELSSNCTLGGYDYVDATEDGRVFALGGYGGPALAVGDPTGEWLQVFPSSAPTGFVDFATESIGFGTDAATSPGAVLVTSDGGVTWAESGTLQTNPDIISFEPGGAGLAIDRVGDKGTLVTRDFGRTWSSVEARMPFDSVVSVAWESSTSGWAITADGQVWQTDDGWRSAYEGGQLPGGGTLMKEGTTWWLHGQSGSLRTSLDDGRTWRTVQPVAVSAALGSATMGWVVLEKPARLLRTADGGVSWTKYDLGTLRPHSVRAAGDSVWIETLPECWYRSTDIGHTWEQLPNMGWDPRCN